MTMTTPLTFNLRSGAFGSSETVLARLTNGEPYPYTFANRTQARNAAAKVGGTVIQRGRPFFVRMPDTTPDKGDAFDMDYEDQCAAQCGPGL